MLRFGGRALLTAILLSVVVFAQTACGEDTGNQPQEDAVEVHPSDEERPLSQVPPPTRLPARTGPTKPTDSFEPITVRGTVVAAVSADCVEVEDDWGIRYALVGASVGAPTAGTRVEFTGLPSPQLRVACDGAVINVSTLTLL